MKALGSYLRFLARSSSRYGVHSPFVFDLVENVFRNRRRFEGEEEIEFWRRHYRASRQRILRVDHGTAGQAHQPDDHVNTAVRCEVKVGAIARRSLLPQRRALQLYHLARRKEAGSILELGTSLGITSAYLASAAGADGRLVTIEGCPATAEIARETLTALDMGHVTILNGTFRDQLPEAIRQLGRIDLAYLDGDHRKGPTLEYFRQIAAMRWEGMVIVLDDIHATEEMESAWEEIKAHPGISLTIDLFRLGLVFFRAGMKPQHFRLRY